MNADCPDTGVQQLPILVPGEADALGLFRQQIFIYQIYSEILDLLYTTWNRRDGIVKIANLEHKLKLWKDACRPEDYYEALDPGKNQHVRTALLRLLVLGDLGHLLIHRPALTFDPSEPQFATSLTACVQASQSIITRLSQEPDSSYLVGVWPLSISTLYQSTIMLLYPWWLGDQPIAQIPEGALRNHVQQVCQLTFYSRRPSTVDGTGEQDSRTTPTMTHDKDIYTELPQFLESLLNLTLHASAGGKGGTLRNNTQDTSNQSQTDTLEDANCRDWESLMLPNAFMSSDWEMDADI